MNPLNWIRDFFKFLYDDIKSDIWAIKEIVRRAAKSEPILRPEFVESLKQEYKEMTVYKFLQENWLFFIMLAFAFISGWWIAQQQYQNTCANWIIDNLMETGMCNAKQQMYNFSSLNITF